MNNKENIIRFADVTAHDLYEHMKKGGTAFLDEELKNLFDQYDIDVESVKQLLETADDNTGNNGCCKISRELIADMGIMGVSSSEMNLLMYLASVQDKTATAYCNYHMAEVILGCAGSTFRRDLKTLKEKGLISYERNGDIYKVKNSLYKIQIMKNDFSDDNYKANTYVRLGHRVFQKPEFLELPVTAKFIIIEMLYKLYHINKGQLSRYQNAPVMMNYNELYKKCHTWNGCTKRTFCNAIREIGKVYKVEKKWEDDLYTNRKVKKLAVYFGADILFGDTADFSMCNNLVLSMFEEHGIHICKDDKDVCRTLAQAAVRNEKKAATAVENAKSEFRKIKEMKICIKNRWKIAEHAGHLLNIAKQVEANRPSTKKSVSEGYDGW